MERLIATEIAEEIIHLLNIDDYSTVSQLINKELYMVASNYYIINVLGMNDIDTTIKTFSALIPYCFVRNDLELLKILIFKSLRCPDKKIEPMFVTVLILPQIYSIPTYDPTRHELFRAIIENIKCDDTNVSSIINNILNLNDSNNKILFLDIMAEYGYYMNDNHIRSAIICNKIDVVQYAIIKNLNVQDVVNKIQHEYSGRFGPKCSESSNVTMLKLLLDNNINLKNNINKIFLRCIKAGNLESVLFLLDLFLVEIDLNNAFSLACKGNYVDIMVHLLKFGADINSLSCHATLNISFDTLKFLIESNHLPHQVILNINLLNCFVNDAHLDNVDYLIKNGGNMNWLIKHDESQEGYENYDKVKQYMETNNNWDQVKSPLEFIITSGKLIHVKFVIDNYFDLIKPHLNRLFVIACANGQNRLASYLYDHGAELSYRALESACFFGHYDTVIFLLKLGMTIRMITIENEQNVNLFSSVFGGNSNYRYDPNDRDKSRDICYNLFINRDDIFRNDIYNFGTNSTYVNIIKLLITYDVPKLNHYTACLGVMPEEFYDIDVFKYFISDGDDLINLKYSSIYEYSLLSLLESSIIHEKLDIIEFLLQKGATGPIENSSAIDTIKKSQPIMNILMRYGIEV